MITIELVRGSPTSPGLPPTNLGGGSLVGLCHEGLLEENALQKLNFLLAE
jgi:hypothetical protein